MDGELIDTEVQLWVEDYFVDRELFYGDKMMIEGLKFGETYQDMPKTRVIAFMDFILREDNPDIVQSVKFMYTKEPIRVASDKIRIYNVELPKFTAEYDSIEDVSGEAEKGNSLLQWLYMHADHIGIDTIAKYVRYPVEVVEKWFGLTPVQKN